LSRGRTALRFLAYLFPDSLERIMEDHKRETSYEAPQIVDHGDLVELTAGQQGRKVTDVNLPAGFPSSQTNFFTTNP
jgi:hypothetical protein